MAWKTTEETLRRYNGRHPRQICIVAPGRMGLRPDESRETTSGTTGRWTVWPGNMMYRCTPMPMAVMYSSCTTPPREVLTPPAFAGTQHRIQ
ncbi:MAG: hypothetical protein V8Q30_11390 [Acutalibacteraceae bacterium]